MGLQELILEAIEELGDPDELVNNEDLVVLKLEQACTNKRIIPEDVELSGDARRLSMSQQAFVTCRAFLGNLRYSAALFAGCCEFSSSKAFLETAKYVLKNVRSLVLVHNRNKILNLVNWFPTVTTIVLYHNLRLNADKGVMTSALTMSRMEQLLGTTPALGLDHLSLGKDTLRSLFTKCPKLASVMSSDMETALCAKKVVTVDLKRLSGPIRRKELFLGRTGIHYTGIPLELNSKGAVAVERAHRHFPEAEHLELTAACESAIRKVASYTKVTHLSLFSAMPKDESPFEPLVTEVLSVLQLVHLSLTHFCGVKLSGIAKLCPQLKFLGIRVCAIDDEGDAAAKFSNLEHLRVGSEMKEESFFKLLKSCPGLRELEIDKDELTTAFVLGPEESCVERPVLKHVERLTLRTNTDWFDICSLDYVAGLPSALDSALSGLPSLRRVRTDNYDIRHHINSRFPNIALDWCMCTLCASEFPKINEQQREVYSCTQYLKLPRPIEYVDIKGEDNKDVKAKAESPTKTKKERMKAQVSADSREEELKVEDVAIDTKDKKMKAEAIVDIKGEEVNAEALVDNKELEVKAEAPADPENEIIKKKVVVMDAEDHGIKAEEIPVDVKQEKMKAEKVAVDVKECERKEEALVDIKEEKSKAEEAPVDITQEKLPPRDVVQQRYEDMIRERRRVNQEKRKFTEEGKADSKCETMLKEDDEVLDTLPSLTEQKVASGAEEGWATVSALDPLKAGYKSLEEPD